MPSSTSNSASQASKSTSSPSSAYEREHFFGHNYEGHLEGLSLQEYYTKFKDNIASLILDEQEKGTAEDAIKTMVKKYSFLQIVQLPKSMKEEQNLPEEQQEIAIFHQMDQIATKIMESGWLQSRWLQNLKNTFEAFLLEKLEQGTPPNDIEALAHEFIDQRIDEKRKTMLEEGNTAEAIAEVTENASQELEQFLAIELINNEWFQKLRDQCKPFILEWLQQETALPVIKKQLRNHVALQIEKMRDFLTEKGGTILEIAQFTEKALQGMEQFVNEITEDGWLQNLKNKCEAFIAKQLGEGMAPDDIANEIQQNIDQIVKQHHESLKKQGIPAEEIKEEIEVFSSDLTTTVAPLLSKLQESQQAAHNDLSGMQSPIISPKGRPAAAQPASTPHPSKGRSIKP